MAYNWTAPPSAGDRTTAATDHHDLRMSGCRGRARGLALQRRRQLHQDEEVQPWFVHHVAVTFSPDQLTHPPGAAIPPDPEIGILYDLERGKLYDFHVRSDQIVNIVEGETGDWHFSAGANFIEWSR